MFKRMDADGDGAISAEEFASKPNRMFDRFDKDGDGVIAIDEIPDRKAGFRGKRGDMPPPPPPEDE
jgi:Ca2+-binding EF-hand superfamily protein